MAKKREEEGEGTESYLDNEARSNKQTSLISSKKQKGSYANTSTQCEPIFFFAMTTRNEKSKTSGDTFQGLRIPGYRVLL